MKIININGFSGEQVYNAIPTKGGNEVKNLLWTARGVVPLTTTDWGRTSELNRTTDEEVMAVAIAGADFCEAVHGRTKINHDANANINPRIMQLISKKVELEFSGFLEDVKASGMTLDEFTDESNDEVDAEFGLKGLKVSVDNEEIEFAGGTIIINGNLGLKLQFLGGGKLVLETSGELISELHGIKRQGNVSGTIYDLSLNGSNRMEVKGSFTVGINNWNVGTMTANLTSSIVDSDIISKGLIGGRSVEGSVDFIDMTFIASNDDVLHHPMNFSLACSGDIETTINDEDITPSTLGLTCKYCL